MSLEPAAMSLITWKEFGSTPAEVVRAAAGAVTELAEITGHVAALAGLSCYAAVIASSRHTEILTDPALAAHLSATSDGFHYARIPARHASHALQASASHLEQARTLVPPNRYPIAPERGRRQPTTSCLDMLRRYDRTLFQRRLTTIGAFNAAALELARFVRCIDTATRQITTALSGVLDELADDPQQQRCGGQLAEAITTAAGAQRALRHSGQALQDTTGDIRGAIARLYRLRRRVNDPLYPITA